jgi:hypothetical protein
MEEQGTNLKWDRMKMEAERMKPEADSEYVGINYEDGGNESVKNERKEDEDGGRELKNWMKRGWRFNSAVSLTIFLSPDTGPQLQLLTTSRNLRRPLYYDDALLIVSRDRYYVLKAFTN